MIPTKAFANVGARLRASGVATEALLVIVLLHDLRYAVALTPAGLRGLRAVGRYDCPPYGKLRGGAQLLCNVPDPGVLEQIALAKKDVRIRMGTEARSFCHDLAGDHQHNQQKSRPEAPLR